MSTTTYLKSTEWTRSSCIPHYQKLNIWIIFILITVRLITAILQGGNQIYGSPIQGSTALMYKNTQRYKITLDDKIYIRSKCETLKKTSKKDLKSTVYKCINKQNVDEIKIERTVFAPSADRKDHETSSTR